jgi:hypothetical protein
MKWLCRFAARLYPSWWRRRYATEFEALLEDVTPGWRALFDVITGALTMQIKTPGTIPVVCALARASRLPRETVATTSGDNPYRAGFERKCVSNHCAINSVSASHPGHACAMPLRTTSCAATFASARRSIRRRDCWSGTALSASP